MHLFSSNGQCVLFLKHGLELVWIRPQEDHLSICFGDSIPDTPLKVKTEQIVLRTYETFVDLLIYKPAVLTRVDSNYVREIWLRGFEANWWTLDRAKLPVLVSTSITLVYKSISLFFFFCTLVRLARYLFYVILVDSWTILIHNNLFTCVFLLLFKLL